jgi:small-conductance mechanosensitive channel
MSLPGGGSLHRLGEGRRWRCWQSFLSGDLLTLHGGKCGVRFPVAFDDLCRRRPLRGMALALHTTGRLDHDIGRFCSDHAYENTREMKTNIKVSAFAWQSSPSMQDLIHQIVSLSLGAKLVFAVLGVSLIQAVFRLLERRLPSQFHELNARYRARKFAVFSGYIVGLVFIAVLFADRLGRVSFALGVAGAGLVVSLQDVIASLAGWLAIGWSNLYKVGDRIQIGETRGDVIDISFMRTEIVETGNWVNDDLYNGRVARIPNSAALKGPIFNYSQGFRYIWDEIKVPLTADSNHLLAREMLLRIAHEAVAGYLSEAQSSWSQVTSNFRIENLSLAPTVSLIVKGGSLEFSLSYIVDYTNRTAIQDWLFSKIVEEIKNCSDQLAWATSSSGVRGGSQATHST